MRTVIRSLAHRSVAVLAVVCLLCAVTPGWALAGGPTSVLLASPVTDAAAALYYTDTDYARLSDLLGGTGSLDASTEPPPPAAATSPYVTATWLIHDVSVWRIDRIFLVGDDVWVVTESTEDGGPLTGQGMFPGEAGTSSAIWHRPADGVALTSLLAAHGLTASAPAVAADPPAQRATPVDTGSASVGLWAIGGLLAGLAIGGAFVRMIVGRRDTPEPEPEPARIVPVS